MAYRLYISDCVPDGGVYACTLSDTGVLSFDSKRAVPSPMYTCIYKNNMHIVLRDPFEDSKDSGVVVGELLPDGSIGELSCPSSTEGVVACHIAVNENGIYTANYLSGSIKREGGALACRVGHGPNVSRQSCAHMHQVTLMADGNVIACDLGSDKVAVYEGSLEHLLSEAEVPSGHGARHIVVAKNGADVWCLNELASTVTKMVYFNGTLKSQYTFKVYPERDITGTTAAAIRLSADESVLYISNRGFDLITAIDVSGEVPAVIGSFDSHGISPRDFDITPDGKFMVVTNEKTGVAVMEMNGYLPSRNADVYPMAGPLCVEFAPI